MKKYDTEFCHSRTSECRAVQLQLRVRRLCAATGRNCDMLPGTRRLRLNHLINQMCYLIAFTDLSLFERDMLIAKVFK